MQQTRAFRRAAMARVAFGAGAWLAGALSALAAAAVSEPIRPGDSIEVVLEAGQSRNFALPMGADEFVEGTLQLDSPSEPSLTIQPPGRAPLNEMGALWPGREQPFWVVAETAGSLGLQLRYPKNAASPVRFRIRVVAPRAAVETDRVRFQALATLAAASAAIDRGEWNEAKGMYREIAALFARAGDVRGEGQALHMLAWVCQRVDPTCHWDSYARALERRTAAGDDAGLALTLKNMGDGLRLGSRFAEAEEHLNRSVEAWRRAHDRPGEAGSLNNLGTVAMMQGEYRRAVDLLGRALAIQEELSDVEGQARALSNLSTAYRSLGELGQALDCAERSLPLRRRVSDKRGEAYSLGNLGDTWRALGEPEKALEYDLQAFAAIEQAGPTTGRSEFHITIAQSQMALGNEEAALAALEQTTAIARQEKTPRLLGRSLAIAGDLFAARGAHREAIERYVAALRVIAEAPDRTYETSVSAALCRSHVALGELDAAEVHCRRATEMAAILGLPSLETLALVAQADLARAQGDLRGSAALLDRAFVVIEAVRDRVPAGARASYLADRQRPYRFWLEVLAALNRDSPNEGWDRRAFHASERLKARALLEEIVESRGDVAQSVDPKLGAQRRDLEARLAGTQRTLSDPKLPETERRRLETRLAELEAEYERLVREVSRRASTRAALRYPRPAGAVEAAAALPENVALIAYALGQKGATAFVLTRRSFRAVVLPIDPSDLDRRVRNYTELLSRSGGEAGKMAERLGRDLLAPLAPEIPATIRGLVVVPDGPLHALPFEVMPGLRGRSTLLEEFSIAYVPSATLYVALRGAERPDPPASLLALADPGSHAESAGSERLRYLYEREGLASGALPHASREARALRRLVGRGSEVYLGEDATEERAKQKLAQFGIVHFATHGLVSERHPARSALRLASRGSEDGFLQAREIANLRVAADLVVLSGCRTARGRLLAGEGPQSLARAFFQAGAASVVASLWDVGDEATATLMERFYAELAAGRSRGDSLREAKLSLLREGRPPSEWAAFVLLGEGEGGAALHAASDWRGLLPALALVAAGAIALLVSFRRLRVSPLPAAGGEGQGEGAA